jgi:xanthine dehydrogenase YagT iron-sulfur-binding subunit
VFQCPGIASFVDFQRFTSTLFGQSVLMNDKVAGVTLQNEPDSGAGDSSIVLGQDLRSAANPASLTSAQELAVELRVNGRNRRVVVDTRVTLLDCLRDELGLTGTKKGCDHGQCGACTVMIDSRRMLSCLMLAAAADGAEIVTIEGIAVADALHPMQQAFVDQDAFQCGYCTPGQIISAIGCIAEGHAKSDAEIREYMSGNLCRCAAYPNIVAAILQARAKMAGE